ncbi:MAG: hypothetical protein WA775_15160 [Psychroserpens sp.]|uniref:hypothetical protein n=1 Tax=Psychroserpens sp. TaxID=2020870 RepID=UPI003CBBAA91
MKKTALHTIKHSGFKVPDNYFSEVEARILTDVALREHGDQSGFQIPDAYLKELDDKILAKVSEEKSTKVISTLNWRQIASVSAIAASLVLMFQIFYSSENNTEQPTFDTLEIGAIENYIDQETYTSLDLASLLTEEELSKDTFIDDELSEKTLETYLLEQDELDDLILEQLP